MFKRIREPYIRASYEAQAHKSRDAVAIIQSPQEEHESVCNILGRFLSEKTLQCTPKGDEKPICITSTKHIDAGSPLTGFPNDSCPSVVLWLIQNHTKPGSLWIHLFAQSVMGRSVTELYNQRSGDPQPRRVFLVDEYQDSETLYGGHLLGDAYRHAKCNDCKDGNVELIFVTCPMPGLLHTLKFRHLDADRPVGRMEWEGRSKEDFLQDMTQLLILWSQLLKDDAIIAIQCGWARWEGIKQPLWPILHEIAHKIGLVRLNHLTLEITPLPGPANEDLLREVDLLIYKFTRGVC